MPDLIELGAEWLSTVRRGARVVTYKAGTHAIDVPAEIGSSDFVIDHGLGTPVQMQTRDFVIATSRLVLQGSLYEPLAGNRIVERDAANGTEHTYEVLAPGSEPCWRWADPYRKRRRIHTKEVSKT